MKTQWQNNTMCHNGLVKDDGGHLVNQTFYPFL